MTCIEHALDCLRRADNAARIDEDKLILRALVYAVLAIAVAANLPTE